MKLRFEVDQAESFRRGVDCPKRLATIEVNPADLTEHLREAIAVRMSGRDVYELFVAPDFHTLKLIAGPNEDARLLSPLPTWEGFLVALQMDIERVTPEIQQIERGFELIRRSGLKIDVQVADRFGFSAKQANVSSMIAMQKFIDGKPDGKLPLPPSPLAPELN